MTVIHTEQPFSEIADGLIELGYTEEGSAVTQEGERFEQVADAGDGIVVIGNNGAAADAVAADSEGPTALLDLLEPADQPIAAAANGIPDDCVTALGGWENAELTEGTLSFVFDSEASAENFDLEELNELASHHGGGAERRRRNGRDRLHHRAGRPGGQSHPRDADPVRLRLRLRLRRGRTPQPIAV